jgi:TPR repeat protein
MALTHLSLSFAFLFGLAARSQRPAFGRAALRCVVALCALQSFTAASQTNQKRGFDLPDQSAQTAVTNGGYYALVIGIDHYRPPMKTLQTAVNDAQAMGKLLEQHYGFKVTYLLDQNATRFNILDALSRYRNTLGENDSLLIYYAGHGFSDHDADKAYWLPVDADSGTSPNRIIADDLTTGVRVLPSRHVLIISDSCYSGGLSRGADAPEHPGSQPAFVARMLKSRSRTLMASGGDEPVSDSGSNGHSVFAYAILRSLERADQPMFTASDLFYSSVRQQVAGNSEQLPQYTVIRNSSHDEGDFVFTRKNAPAATASNGKLSPLEAFNQGQAMESDNRFAEAAPLFASACSGGNSGSCTELGWLYQNAKGVGGDDKQAVTLYRKACDANDGRACNNLGSMQENGRGIEKDESKAVALYFKGCDHKNGIACANLGRAYDNGMAVIKDPAKAFAFYQMSCDDGFAPGCTDVGLDLASGKGVGRDDTQATALYKKACEGNDAQGCNNLGAMYLNGRGVARDEMQAVTLARKGCDGGYMQACNNLGWMYQNGRGIGQDDNQAATMFRKACDGGLAQGCTFLGLAYFNGKGVDKDLSQAVTLYHKACDGNDPQGCNNLGAMYINATGVARDEVQAAVLARKACDGGYFKACSNLGWLYENGRGVDKDLHAAAKFYKLACDAKIDDGCTGLKRLQP